MPHQLIIYEKENGVITQVLYFNSDNSVFTLNDLQLDRKHDITKLGFLVEKENRYIDIKKDRIFNEKITQIAQINSDTRIIKPQNKSHQQSSLFEEVSYKKLPENVGLITPWNKECGISNYSMDLVDRLQCQITIFCEKDNNPDYKNPKVKVIPCWTNRDNSYGYLVELLKKNKIDVCHVQYNHDLMNAGQLKVFGKELKENGIRSILTLHSSKGGVDVYGKSFDTMIVHSEISSLDLIGENATKDQVEIIPIGTPKPQKPKDKKIACIEKNLDYNRPIIANFGFLLPQKGVKEQIKVLEKIKKEFNNILLLVVCSIHKSNEEISLKYFNDCKQLVDDLGLNENVIFLTEYLPYNEIFEYLYCADLIVLPYLNSAAQAASSAGRTALSAFRPVLVTDVEIFADLQDIVPKVPPRDEEKLEIAIIELLKNTNKQKLILDNIKRFIEKTSWENVAKEHCKVYKSFGDIKIDIEGQVFSYFSASVVNRNLACALHKLGCDVSLKSVNLAENRDYELGDESRDLVIKPQTKMIQVKHQFPPSFEEYDARTKIIYLAVETSVPDDWLTALEHSNLDFIWVYTNHQKELLRKAGVKIPVEIIRCGFDKNLFNENVIPIDLGNIRDSYTKKTVDIKDSTFVFMFIGHAQERKNFKTMFKSYLAEFNKNDDVVFVIKSYDGGEIHKVILEIVEYVSSVMEKPKESLPKFLYIYEDTEPQILPTYYKAANVMCQCSRAEGFGKPIVEAMGMGIPSISILWSGPKDFCTEYNSFPVPFKLIKSSYHVQSKQSESIWADTKIEDLREVMRYCFDNPDEIKKRGKQALIDSEKWTTEEVAFDVINFVRKYNL